MKAIMAGPVSYYLFELERHEGILYWVPKRRAGSHYKEVIKKYGDSSLFICRVTGVAATFDEPVPYLASDLTSEKRIWHHKSFWDILDWLGTLLLPLNLGMGNLVGFLFFLFPLFKKLRRRHECIF